MLLTSDPPAMSAPVAFLGPADLVGFVTISTRYLDRWTTLLLTWFPLLEPSVSWARCSVKLGLNMMLRHSEPFKSRRAVTLMLCQMGFYDDLWWIGSVQLPNRISVVDQLIHLSLLVGWSLSEVSPHHFGLMHAFPLSFSSIKMLAL